MKKSSPSTEFWDLPRMLYADGQGRIYEHPYFRMAGFFGRRPAPLAKDDLIPMPEFSKLFYLPGCAPLGLDPETGKYGIVSEIIVGGERVRCLAVAAFPEPGLVRSHLPAADYRLKDYTLPLWGYTAVGFKRGRYRIAAFRVESNFRWDPRNFDDRELMPAIRRYQEKQTSGPLLEHLIGCAVQNHCFAAKNLFLGRWEAPLPVSRRCNARCLGCLSLQGQESCAASHRRIGFKPDREEIVALAVRHLQQAPDAVVSFGQGCEGEPLTEYRLIADCIREIRRRTDRGTINLNTNGSLPERVRLLAQSGLDSIRVSLNSARPSFYQAYYRPQGYTFQEVCTSLKTAVDQGLFTMVNYLVFPGITDQETELKAIQKLIRRTGLNFLHLKNLNIDPELYLSKLPFSRSPSLGLKNMVTVLKKEFPGLQLGYFNQPVKRKQNNNRTPDLS